MRRRAWLLAWLPALVGAEGCSGVARLPSPPPRVPQSELARWQQPPPLTREVPMRLRWTSTRVRLENGLGVTLIARPEGRTTAIRLWVPTARDVSDGPVTAMAECLRAGTRHGSGDVLLNPKLGGVSLEITTGQAGTYFEWDVLPQATKQAIELMNSFVLRPAFDEGEVKLRLQERIAAIQRWSGSLDHLVQTAYNGIPGLESPSPEQEIRALLKLGAKDMKELHGCTMLPATSELVVVGPMGPETVVPWITSTFSGWRAEMSPEDPACRRWALPAMPADPAKSTLSRIELQVVYASNPDPWLAMVVPGPGVESNDYLPFSLLGDVLTRRKDGSTQNMRHAGSTYGIHSEIRSGYQRFSSLELRGLVEPSMAQEAIQGIVADLHTIADTVTESELEDAKRAMRTRILHAFASNSAVASYALGQIRRGRDPRSLEELLNEPLQVSLAQTRQVANRWMASAVPSIAISGATRRLVVGLGLDVHVQRFYWTDRPQESKKQ